MDEKGIDQEQLPVLKFHLIEAVDKLSECGCTHILVACNTAHALITELRKQFAGTILDIIDIACDHVSASCGTVGIISSETTRRSGLYVKPLRARGKNPIAVSLLEQKVLDAAILEAVSDRQTRATGMAVGGILEALAARGAEEIIVGCTELPMVIDWKSAPVRLIDPGRSAVKVALSAL